MYIISEFQLYVFFFTSTMSTFISGVKYCNVITQFIIFLYSYVLVRFFWTGPSINFFYGNILLISRATELMSLVN